MLYSTVEFISLASSNSLAAFCFCNFLIAILLVGNLKPSSEFNEEKKLSEFPSLPDENNFKKLEVPCHEKSNDLIVEAEEESVPDENNFKKLVVRCPEKSNDVIVEAEEEHASSLSITIVDNEEEEERWDEDEDELRKRVEEFIEKTNRGWMAEKLKIQALGQQCI